MEANRYQGFEREVLHALERIEKGIYKMAVDQAAFDADLAVLVQEIADAVAALVASKSPADLTAEDQAVQKAVADLQAALAPPAA